MDISLLASQVLGLSALILSIVNGLMLLRNYLRDKAILTVRPVHPGVYQWWFRLPDGEYKGMPTRRYGFLLYVDISNSGLRKVGLESWRLHIKSLAERSAIELLPLTIPEVILVERSFTKRFRVLGQRGPTFTGETVVDSGCSIAGWAYFATEYHGDASWNPVIKDDRINGTFVVRDIFGGKTQTEIGFRRQELQTIEQHIPGIATVPTPGPFGGDNPPEIGT